MWKIVVHTHSQQTQQPKQRDGQTATENGKLMLGSTTTFVKIQI